MPASPLPVLFLTYLEVSPNHKCNKGTPKPLSGITGKGNLLFSHPQLSLIISDLSVVVSHLMHCNTSGRLSHSPTHLPPPLPSTSRSTCTTLSDLFSPLYFGLYRLVFLLPGCSSVYLPFVLMCVKLVNKLCEQSIPWIWFVCY